MNNLLQKWKDTKITSESIINHKVSGHTAKLISPYYKNEKYNNQKYIKKITAAVALTVLLQSFFEGQALAEATKAVPDIASEAAIVIDGENGSILFEKEADKTLYPASLTKIATAIYAIETGDLQEVTTVSERAKNAEGTRVYLEAGEQVTLEKLVQGLLINSGNDAGIAIAEQLSGSVEQYANDINGYLKNVVGVEHTNFQNPHGLFDESHVTTAEDLAKITQYAMQNEKFREIFGTKSLEWDGETWDTTLYSHHKLLIGKGYEGITGGKTGYVDESGVTLATTAEKDNQSLIIITMKSESQAVAYGDAIHLLDYGFGDFQTTIIPAGSSFDYNDNTYMVPVELSYTHAADAELTEVMEGNGVLNIEDENGEIINSFQLELASQAGEADQAASALPPEDNAGPIWKSALVKVLLAATAIAVCGAGFFNRRTTQQRYRKVK